MKRVVPAALLLAGIICTSNLAFAKPGGFTPKRTSDVMTYNVYVGADLLPVLSATTEAALLDAVGQAWANVELTDIPLRASEIADEIASSLPSVVGLQEVARWSTGPTLDTPNVQFDFLDLILARLAVDGAHYTVVTSHDNGDAVAPMVDVTGLVYVRLLDRDVVLARTDLPAANLKISNVQSQTFAAVLTIVNPLLGSVSFPRSWISADLKVRGKTFRFVTTHLETYDVSIQQAQAQELLEGPADTDLPVVMVGDYNSSANGGPDTTPTYPMLLSDGFEDAWTLTNADVDGNTCCQLPDLSNEVSQLYERIDLILVKNGTSAASSGLINVEAEQSPFWASDHAALTGTLQIPTKTAALRGADR